jgi:hypothetical protein
MGNGIENDRATNAVELPAALNRPAISAVLGYRTFSGCPKLEIHSYLIWIDHGPFQ